MKGCKVVCLGVVVLATSAGARCQDVAAPRASASSTQTASKLLSLNFTKIAVADVLQMIAQEGDLDVIIRENVTGTLPRVQLKDQTPEQCLQWVAKAAGLRLIKLNSKTFLVDKLAPLVNSITRKITLSIVIQDMPLRDAFLAIASKGNVQVFLDDSVQGRAGTLVLNDVEPVEALRRLAFSSGCSFVATKNVQPDGTLETECFVAKSRRAFPSQPQTLPDTAPDNVRPEIVKPPIVKPPGQPHAELKIIPLPDIDPAFSRPLAPPPR